jgi:hypothetical protein
MIDRVEHNIQLTIYGRFACRFVQDNAQTFISKTLLNKKKKIKIAKKKRSK